MRVIGTFLETFWLGMALHLWQTSLVLAFLLVVALGLRRAPARYAEVIGWIALLKLVLPLSVLGALLGPALAMFGGPVSGAAAGLTEYARVVLEPAVLASPTARAPNVALLLYVALTVVWLLGVAVLCRRWSSSAGEVHEATLELAAAPPAIGARIQGALRGTRIARESVRLVRSHAIPLVRGLLQPTIVLSQPVVESLSMDELRAALLHEEEHRRRWDTLRAVVQRGILATFFFYPPVWWVVSRLRALAELACDESVLSRGVSPAVYARTLARVLATNLGMMPSTRPTEVCLNRPGGLPARLDRIENAWRYRAMTKHRVLAIVAMLVVSTSFVVPALLGQSVKSYSKADAEVASEMAAKLEGQFADLAQLALDPNPILLEFDRTALRTVFGVLEKGTGIHFDIVGSLSRPVSISYANLTPREVLERLATAFQLSYEVRDAWTVRVRHTPLLAGVGDVTNPVLIPASKVGPVYPEDAKVERVEGIVILQAVVFHDGTVGDIELLRANRPNMGFEDAAIEAVRQWRYEPAIQDGVPVDVYFTIFIDFSLR
jgi:TonB family protein